METNTSFKSGKFAEKISIQLKRAQHEIEEFASQLALDKTDAIEKFEEIKRDFNIRAQEWMKGFADLKSVSIENASKLKARFDDLQLQLALGKAEAKDLFEEQRKKILTAIHEFEAEIKSHPEMNERLDEFRNEIEKFKLKLEILKLKFELKKFDLKDDFKSGMTEARIKIDKLFDRVEEKTADARKKYSDFGVEIELAFKHIKNAVRKL